MQRSWNSEGEDCGEWSVAPAEGLADEDCDWSETVTDTSAETGRADQDDDDWSENVSTAEDPGVAEVPADDSWNEALPPTENKTFELEDDDDWGEGEPGRLTEAEKLAAISEDWTDTLAPVEKLRAADLEEDWGQGLDLTQKLAAHLALTEVLGGALTRADKVAVALTEDWNDLNPTATAQKAGTPQKTVTAPEERTPTPTCQRISVICHGRGRDPASRSGTSNKRKDAVTGSPMVFTSSMQQDSTNGDESPQKRQRQAVGVGHGAGPILSQKRSKGPGSRKRLGRRSPTRRAPGTSASGCGVPTLCPPYFCGNPNCQAPVGNTDQYCCACGNDLSSCVKCEHYIPRKKGWTFCPFCGGKLDDKDGSSPEE